MKLKRHDILKNINDKDLYRIFQIKGNKIRLSYLTNDGEWYTFGQSDNRKYIIDNFIKISELEILFYEI